MGKAWKIGRLDDIEAPITKDAESGDFIPDPNESIRDGLEDICAMIRRTLVIECIDAELEEEDEEIKLEKIAETFVTTLVRAQIKLGTNNPVILQAVGILRKEADIPKLRANKENTFISNLVNLLSDLLVSDAIIVLNKIKEKLGEEFPENNEDLFS